MKSACFYKRIDSSDTFVKVPQGNIYYWQEGKGSSLLYIHGNLGSHLDFSLSPIAQELTANYTVTSIDRWGAGYSKRKQNRSVTLEEHADIIAEVIKELAIEKTMVVGHSYGGAVSLMLALRHPELLSGLVLIAPAAHDWEGDPVSEYRLLTRPFIGPLLMETVFVPFASFSMKSAFKSVFQPADPPPQYLDEAARVALVPPHFVSSALDMQVVRPGLRTISEHYQDISTPTVVLAGGKDTITPYWNHGERLKAALPRVAVHLIPEAGHQIHFSHPQQVVEAVEVVEKMKSAKE